MKNTPIKKIPRKNFNDSNKVPRTHSSYNRKQKNVFPILFLLVAVLVLSTATAGIWQFMDKTPYIEPSSSINSTSSESSSSTSDSEESNTLGVTSDSSISESAEQVKFGLVPETEWERNRYFNDAVFVGDSITDGIKLYDIMSNATVLSHTGININNIMTKPVISENGTEITIIDKLATLSPKKIYVMMGANSMGLDKGNFIKYYKVLIEKIMQLHPDSIIYVQSVLPVTKRFEDNRKDFSNTKIDEYNQALLEMCEDMQIYYLNVAEVFKDENGRLPNEASPHDGMHFGPTWYKKWFDYLHSHAIKV